MQRRDLEHRRTADEGGAHDPERAAGDAFLEGVEEEHVGRGQVEHVDEPDVHRDLAVEGARPLDPVELGEPGPAEDVGERLDEHGQRPADEQEHRQRRAVPEGVPQAERERSRRVAGSP